jgi:hypothetical protein
VCRVLNWSTESERERSSHFPYSSWSPSRQRVSKANQALLEYPDTEIGGENWGDWRYRRPWSHWKDGRSSRPRELMAVLPSLQGSG